MRFPGQAALYSCFCEGEMEKLFLRVAEYSTPPNLGLIAPITLDETQNFLRRMKN